MKLRAEWQKYLDLLLLWNRRINLTAVRDPEEIVEKHFLDSLAVVPHVPAETRSLIDVGSGPGFPGAIIALERPALAVTLLESNHKKTAFLSTLRREIPLPNVTVVSERLEVFVRSPRFTPFDVAVSRATWELPTWLEHGRTLVRPGGTVLGMEAAEQFELPAAASRHPYSLGSAKRAVIVLRT